ncbi:MAG: peptide-methionine (R)-S-oxide reductase MsrB [Flavobacteriales bacterium]|nr:peptide-methionine (R)-S-oxide reductase MsrB [Flavobacteriales bacterium]
MKNNAPKMNLTEEEWKEKLSPEEFQVLRQKGTERAFTGKYTDNKEEGIYVCKGCGTELFSSETKFDSHCGWPSFYDGIDKSKITETLDLSHGMTRTEVTCSNCGGHLGHVFNDGPTDKTGLRYCINSISLGFIEKQEYDSLLKKK